MVTFSGDRGASAWFRAASGGTAAVVTPRIPCGEGASGADTARPRQQASRRKEAACRPPCTTQVERAPENQHLPLVGVGGDVDRSTRRTGERTPRRLDRHSRRAHCAKWCRLPEHCRMDIRRIGLQKDHFWCSARRIADDRRRADSERRRGGSGQRSDFGEPGAAVAAHKQQQQQLAAAQPPCQSHRQEAVRVERRC